MSKGIVRSGLALGFIIGLSLAAGLVTAAQAGAQQKPAYTYAEYNAYQAAVRQANPQERVKLLDVFVSKFPKSTLLPYVYQSYYKTYDQLKQYKKVIEYADKLVTSTSKAVNSGMKLQADYAREVAFNYVFDPKAPDATAQATAARKNAALGLKLLDGLTKPKTMSDAQFAQQKKGPSALFSYTAGYASLVLKDYPAAEKGFRDALTVDPSNPGNAVTYFRLGVAYLAQAAQQQAAAPTATAAPAAQTPPATAPASTTTPAPAAGAAAAAPAPQLAPLPGPSAGQQNFINGFWALARSIALKGSTQQQVQSYLQNQMLAYQKTACQPLLTAELNQLLQSAQTTQTIDPPAGYTLPSGVQLNAYLTNSNLFTIMQDLQAGGDRTNFVWLAVCGNEFPMVPIKVISVTPNAAGTGVDMQVYAGSTPQDIEKATTANMEVLVPNQPDALRLKKDNIVRFTGTLSSFDPPPAFLLHWTSAQVNPADIPPVKPGGRKKAAARHHG